MRALLIIGLLCVGCSAPTDERATEDGSVAQSRCESCHVADFESADSPPHAGELPATCFVCHTQAAWAPARLAHDFYPLTGMHAQARCFSCHRMGTDDNEPRFEGTGRECVSCHRDDYDRSPFPGHGRFGFACADCHATAGWSPSLHGPPDAWVPMPDAGVGWGELPDGLDGIGHASGRGGGSIGLRPSESIEDTLGTAPVDAGRPRRPRRRRPPPTTTDPPPPTVIDEIPPDISSGPTQMR